MCRSAASATLVAGLLLAFLLGNTDAKYDPETLRIRAFCIGESYFPETKLPLLIQGDPRVYYVPIPANLAEATFAATTEGEGEQAVKKFLRLYLPRTYESLISSFDVAMIADYEAWLVPTQHYEWMRRAIEEEAMGLAKYEINWEIGRYTKGNFIDLWIASPLNDVFPADFVIGRRVSNSNGIVPAEDNPVTDLPEIEKFNLLTSGDYGIETPKEGAVVLATFRNDPEKNPAMISRPFGKGNSLSVVPGLDKIDPMALEQYQFYTDFWVNQIYWAASFPIPEDVILVSQLRRGMVVYSEQKALIISVIDFIDKLGAATWVLNKDLGEVDEAKGEVDRLYMEGMYARSLDKLTGIFAMLGDVSDKAVMIEKRALFSIYLIEWFTVTGTAMFSAFVLYTVMMKRRYYREVEVTRAR